LKKIKIYCLYAKQSTSIKLKLQKISYFLKFIYVTFDIPKVIGIDVYTLILLITVCHIDDKLPFPTEYMDHSSIWLQALHSKEYSYSAIACSASQNLQIASRRYRSAQAYKNYVSNFVSNNHLHLYRTCIGCRCSDGNRCTISATL
jgi:hypothetical protein